MTILNTSGRAAVGASIACVATHLPDSVLSNEQLSRQFPDWPAEKIYEKTGIRERRIAGEAETALDLGYQAGRKLLASGGCSAQDVDFLIFCTQAPDYILPTSACLLQERLGLRKSIGAVDINLGCSGFVYGLALSSGLIAAGSASNVLLITADTYSKYINPKDKSVRTLFGDGAAATLISRSETGSIGPFVFGTDGSGAHSLIVEAGGFRSPSGSQTCEEKEDRSGNIRSRENLYMDGAAVMNFTLREVPRAFRALLEKAGTTAEDYNCVVLHQANKFMVDALQKKLGLPDEKVPRFYENIGNTVSSTIPFVLADRMAAGTMPQGSNVIMMGFGVGLSWAAVSVKF